MPDGQARIGDDDAVVKDFNDDMLAGILVVAVSESVDERFAEGDFRILGQLDSLETDDAGVRRVFLRMIETAVSMAPGTLLRMVSATTASSSLVRPG